MSTIHSRGNDAGLASGGTMQADTAAQASTAADRVLGRGALWIAGHECDVTWVQNTSDALIGALSKSFGPGITQAVARELHLQPGSTQPLNERTIQKAAEMASTSAEALQGVKFLDDLFAARPGS